MKYNISYYWINSTHKLYISSFNENNTTSLAWINSDVAGADIFNLLETRKIARYVKFRFSHLVDRVHINALNI